MDALVAPGLVLAGQPFDQRGDRWVEGWATASVRVGPLLGHQAPVPAKDCGRGDQAVPAQRRGQALDECGEQGSVGPVQAGLGVGSAEYGDLVAQDEQLDVFGRRCTAEQRQPVDEPVEDQVEQALRHVHDHGLLLEHADLAGHGLRPTSRAPHAASTASKSRSQT